MVHASEREPHRIAWHKARDPARGVVTGADWRPTIGRSFRTIGASTDDTHSHTIEDLQAGRILYAMASIVCEQGYAGTSIGAVSARARVSRRTFLGQFGSLEDCFLTLLDDGYRRVRQLMDGTFEQGRSWQDWIFEALSSLLELFDDEPLLARVWFVEVLGAGPWALTHRERHLSQLTLMVVERWPVNPDVQPDPAVAAGVMDAVLGVLRSHLLSDRRQPAIKLLGPLMGLITSLSADGRFAAVQIARGEARTRAILAARATRPETPGTDDVRVPALLLDSRALRARACLAFLDEHPGASNRAVADAVGISTHTQISRLLARLAETGLLSKRAGGPGRPNAWTLTPYGAQVAHALRRRVLAS